MPSNNRLCGHCGVKTEKDHNYCHRCGRLLKCPKCSGECDSSFNFCPHCGHSLRPLCLSLPPPPPSLSNDASVQQGAVVVQRSQIQLAQGIPDNHQPRVNEAGDTGTIRHEAVPQGRDGPHSTMGQSQGRTMFQGRDGPLSSTSQLSQGQAAPWETDNPLSPISQLLQGKAKVTCAVGAYSQQQKEGQNSLDMNNNSMTGEKTINHKQRYTAIMKTYTIIIGKLRREEDFQQPPKSRMQVVVTHVEKNGYFFWGQVLSDKLKGNRTNIETLERIGKELQLEESRLGPMKNLGRCAALEDGVCAWNMSTTSEGKHDVLFIDFGNTASLSDTDVCKAAMHIWAIPPMAKPFRLIDSGRNTRMKELLNKKITLEIVARGTKDSSNRPVQSLKRTRSLKSGIK